MQYFIIIIPAQFQIQRQTKHEAKMWINFKSDLISHDPDHFIDVIYIK